MSSPTPTQVVASVRQSFVDIQDECKKISKKAGDRAKAVVALAVKMPDILKDEDKAASDAGLKAMKSLLDEAAIVAKNGGYYTKKIAKVVLAAQASLSALKWESDPPPPPPPPPPPSTDKTKVSFLVDLNQLPRDPVKETTHAVEVIRDGSTHAPATATAQVVGLPEGMLLKVDPADFKAGQARSRVFVTLAPSGAANPAAVASPPVEGMAHVLASDAIEPGTKPSTKIHVVDFDLPPPPATTDRWWLIPGGNLSGNDWNIGWNSTGWGPDKLAPYVQALGRRPEAFCGANHHGATIQGGWDEFMSQVKPNGSSGFGQMLKCGVKGKTWHVLNFYTHPVGVPLGDIIAGKYDDYFVKAGQALRAWIAQEGLEDWQLALRLNKEFNQDDYLKDPKQGPSYGKAVARAIKGLRQGYGMTSRGRLRMTFSPARGLVVGALKDFSSFDTDGSCLFDSISCSTHPASQLNVLANKPYEEQVAGVQEWLRGGYKEGYSYLNSKPDYSALAFARQYKIALSMDEWSPRFETPSGGSGQDLHCAISAAAFDAIHRFIVQYKDMIAWDCVFNANVLQESDSVCPGWAAGSRMYKKLWGK